MAWSRYYTGIRPKCKKKISATTANKIQTDTSGAVTPGQIFSTHNYINFLYIYAASLALHNACRKFQVSLI